MLKLLFISLLSIGVGIADHLIFFPVLESWHSLRMRRLGRPTVGVVTNLISFSLWVCYLRSLISKSKDNILVLGYIAYLVSFFWHGVGVVLGYMIGDWKE